MPEPSLISAIIELHPVGSRWRVVYQGQELAGDLSLHEAKESAERVAATLRENGFKFVRIKTLRPSRGRRRR
jgi:hypothetical protein